MSFGLYETFDWRTERDAMRAADFGKPQDHLSRLLAREVIEAEEAHTEKLLFSQMAEHRREVADTLVVLYSFCMRHGIMPDFKRVMGQVNGQGARSGIYHELYEIAINLHEGKQETNVEAFLALALSLSHHTPNGSMDIPAVMHEVTLKNTANRPAQYYSSIDVSGKKLTPEELVMRYDHSEKCLRIIRDFYNATLQSWMHQQHADLILDFRKSESNIALLKFRLEEHRRIVGSAVVSHLREGVNGKELKGGRVFQSQLQAAGAVALN